MIDAKWARNNTVYNIDKSITNLIEQQMNNAIQKELYNFTTTKLTNVVYRNRLEKLGYKVTYNKFTEETTISWEVENEN